MLITRIVCKKVEMLKVYKAKLLESIQVNPRKCTTQRDLSSPNPCAANIIDDMDGSVTFPKFVVQGVVLSKAYTPFSRASCSRFTGKNIAAQIVAKTSVAQEYMYLIVSFGHRESVPSVQLSLRGIWSIFTRVRCLFFHVVRVIRRAEDRLGIGAFDGRPDGTHLETGPNGVVRTLLLPLINLQAMPLGWGTVDDSGDGEGRAIEMALGEERAINTCAGGLGEFLLSTRSLWWGGQCQVAVLTQATRMIGHRAIIVPNLHPQITTKNRTKWPDRNNNLIWESIIYRPRGRRVNNNYYYRFDLRAFVLNDLSLVAESRCKTETKYLLSHGIFCSKFVPPKKINFPNKPTPSLYSSALILSCRLITLIT